VLIAARAPEVDDIKLFAHLLLVTIIFYSVLYLLLRAHGYANRTVQTFTALSGAELVITLVQIPLLVIGMLFDKSQGLLLMVDLIYIGTIGWDLVVSVHIFRQAFSVSALRASLITIALFCLVVYLKIHFNPASGA
jgi:hypothetical protein